MRFIYPNVRKRKRERERRSFVRSFVLGVGGEGENIDNIIAWCLLKICIVFHIITVIGKKNCWIKKCERVSS